LLRELGYSPTLDLCAVCGRALPMAPAAPGHAVFSAAAGGMVCPVCAVKQRDRRPVTPETWEALRSLSETPANGQRDWSPAARSQIRQILGHYVTYLMGRQPRLLPYLGS
jgi:recombinational DNA repair protein (RecF pathway)